MMSEINESLGTYLQVDTDDGECYNVPTSEESVIRKAFKDWRERRIETVLEIETIGGWLATFPASRIDAFQISSPDSREHDLMHRLRLEEWALDFKTRYGL